MARLKNLKTEELQQLAKANPEALGVFDPEKMTLTAPDGTVFTLALGKVGRSEPVYVRGSDDEQQNTFFKFLKSLDIPELLSGSATARNPQASEAQGFRVKDFKTVAFWYGLKDSIDLEEVKKAIEGVATHEATLKARTALKAVQTAGVDPLTNASLLKGLGLSKEEAEELLKAD